MSDIKELDMVEAQFHWKEAEAFLREAIDRDDQDGYLLSMQARVFAGVNSLWQITEDSKTVGYAVTVVYTVTGLDRVVQIYLAGGDSLESFLEQFDYFVAWALKRDINFIEVQGRKGWEKVLRPLGFRHNYTSLLRRIDERLN